MPRTWFFQPLATSHLLDALSAFCEGPLLSTHHCHTSCSITRDSNPLRHRNGSLFLAARAFAMLARRASLALSDLCPGPGPPITTSRYEFWCRNYHRLRAILKRISLT